MRKSTHNREPASPPNTKVAGSPFLELFEVSPDMAARLMRELPHSVAGIRA